MSRGVATALWALPGAGVALALAVALQAFGIAWSWWSAAALGAALGVLVHAGVQVVRLEPWPAPWPRSRRLAVDGPPEQWAVVRARADLDAARTSGPARRVLHERLAEAAGTTVRADAPGAVLPEPLLAAAEDVLGLRPRTGGDDLGRWRA